MSPERALSNAYETLSKPIVAMAGRFGDASGLNAFERQAEAAGLVAWCGRHLSPLDMAYVSAQFGRQASGLTVLEHHLAAHLGTGLHYRKALQKIILSYCGSKCGIREIRKDMACGMLKAVTYRNSAYDALDALHIQVMNKVGIRVSLGEEERRMSAFARGQGCT